MNSVRFIALAVAVCGLGCSAETTASTPAPTPCKQGLVHCMEKTSCYEWYSFDDGDANRGTCATLGGTYAAGPCQGFNSCCFRTDDPKAPSGFSLCQQVATGETQYCSPGTICKR